MIRSFRAELTKLLRRRVVLPMLAVALLLGAGGAAIVLAAAEPAAELGARAGRARSIEALGDAGGGSEVFRVATSFTGVLVFAVFVSLFAIEFSRGTIRTMLLRQPRRLRLLGGKLGALLCLAAVALAVAEVVAWFTALATAPAFDVHTAAWTSLDALGAAVVDYGAVLLWVSGYAVLGAALGVLLRSVPLALAIGIAWMGPFEHLTQDAWTGASRAFPGLLLEAYVAGGTVDVTASRALATAAVYAVLAGAVAAFVFARRDVTA